MSFWKRTPGENPVTLESRIRKLTIMFVIPVLVLLLLTFSVLFSYSSNYLDILHNVTTASEFNQDFKEDIDLKMYYYVVDSHYSEGLPIEQVQDAQKLAKSLLDTTTKRESYKAINDVLNLCLNLESKIYQIEETKSYDDRQQQLENNIYVLTSLIQDYMYNYLYYEASRLNDLQEEMTRQLYIEAAIVLVVGVGAFMILFRLLMRFGHSITSPVSELCRRVQAISDGDLTVQTPIAAEEYEIQMLSDGFEKMVGRLNQLIEQNRQEQISLRSAELALLQAQINPHFLYNTLDTIIWLIETEKYEQAVDMVTSLSGYFRSSLSKGRDIITLREEEQHVRSYLEIQHVRYKDILEYRIEIQPELAMYEIPKLTLQPLVENALYHGIKLKRGLGMISVKGYEEGEDIWLVVSDNGAGMDAERLEEVRKSIRKEQRVGFGLSTVHERLQLWFGAEYGLSIDSMPGEGTTVRVKIPKQTERGNQG
ncbi:MAG: sensor histidine kinase [Eubacteriales bacterium]|nr:sensor histidine kinase [Eubacteriales bacterium]